MLNEPSHFQQESQAQHKAEALAFQDFVRRTLIYQDQKVMIMGHTTTVFQLATRGLEMGLRNVFAPTSLVVHGGNRGIILPEDYEDLMAQYYGVPRKNIIKLYDTMDMPGADKISCAVEMTNYILAAL